MAATSVPAPLKTFKIDRVDCLQDNYVWLLREPGGKVAVVDPSEAKPVAAALEQLGVKPDYILNTHHHWDHTGGNEELKRKYGLTIVGPKADKDRIPGIDVALGEGDTFDFGQLQMQVFDTPGHTRGHITLYFPQAESVFPGDTLFAMGCGRLFEGTHAQMWSSLSKIAALPPQTTVYCAHEYTQANAKWARAVNPNNEALKQRQQKVAELRSEGKATIPSTLDEELATNPFLRPKDKDIRQTLGVSDSASDLEAFTAVRRHKDNF
jgi:hydroxyacylglutathione hydrolase